MIALAAFVINASGCALLALAMQRHHRQVAAGTLKPQLQRRRRVLGSTALGLSLLVCWVALGPLVGLLLWLGLLSATTLLVALVLAFRPQWLAPPAWAGRSTGRRD